MLGGASTEALVAHHDVDHLIQRMDEAAVDDLSCARRLWRSPEPVRSAGLTDEHGSTDWYVHVLDVSACGPRQ